MEEFITGALFSKLGREYVFKLAILDIKNMYSGYFKANNVRSEEMVWRNLHAAVRKTLHNSASYGAIKHHLEETATDLLSEIESNSYKELRSHSTSLAQSPLASDFVAKVFDVAFESCKISVAKEDVQKIADAFLELFIREEVTLLKYIYDEVVKQQKEAAAAAETTVTVKEQLEIARRASERMQELMLIANEAETKEKMEFYVEPDWYREAIFNLIGHDFSGFKGFPLKDLYNSDPEFVVLMVSYIAMANHTIKNSTKLPAALPSWDTPTVLYPEHGGFQRILAKTFLTMFMNQVISPAIGIPYSEKNNITLKAVEHLLTRVEASKEVRVANKSNPDILDADTRKAFLQLIRKNPRSREEEEILKAILYPVVPIARITKDMMGSWGKTDALVSYVLPEPQVVTPDSVDIHDWLTDRTLIAFSTLGGASHITDNTDILELFQERFSGVNLDIFSAAGKTKTHSPTTHASSWADHLSEEVFGKYPRQLFCLLEHPFHSRTLHELLAAGENPGYLVESIVNYIILRELAKKNPNITLVINRNELPLVFATRVSGEKYIETYVQTYSSFGSSPANNRFIKMVHPIEPTNQLFYGFDETLSMLPLVRKPYRNYMWEAQVPNISHPDLMCFETFRKQLAIDRILEKARNDKLEFHDMMNTELLSDGIDDSNYRKRAIIALGIDYDKSTDDIWNPYLWVNSGLLELLVKETEMAVRIIKAVDALYHKAHQRQAEPIREKEEQLREMRKVLQIFVTREYIHDVEAYLRLVDFILHVADMQRKNSEEAAIAAGGGVWPDIRTEAKASASIFTEEKLAMIKQIRNIIYKNLKELEKLQDQIVL
jgi:hypothetical protein